MNKEEIAQSKIEGFRLRKTVPKEQILTFEKRRFRCAQPGANTYE